MKIIAISDTHGLEKQVPLEDADVLIHCGDFTRGSKTNIEEFCDWVKSLPHRLVLICPGNHEKDFERNPEKMIGLVESARENVKVIIHGAYEFEGVKFFGSAYQPWFCSWAYNLPRGEALAEKWKDIPDDTDVLATHSPPFGILDQTSDGQHVGCEDLIKRISELKNLKLSLSGHIHEAYGRAVIGKTTFANVAICDENYLAVNSPQVFEV